MSPIEDLTPRGRSVVIPKSKLEMLKNISHPKHFNFDKSFWMGCNTIFM